MAMPHVTVIGGTKDNPVYQVGGKSFVFFRNPRPDAVDPDSGERYRDVIVFWVADEAEKQALVQDESTPFFSTTHFDGHPSVLVQASRLGELSLAELEEIVQDAWLARASRHRAEQWLSSHPAGRTPVRRLRMQRLVLPNECVVDGGGRRRACRIRARPRPGPSPGGGNRQAPQYRQPTGCPDAPTTRSHPPQRPEP